MGCPPGGHGFTLRAAGTPRGVEQEGSRIIDPTDISGISQYCWRTGGKNPKPAELSWKLRIMAVP